MFSIFFLQITGKHGTGSSLIRIQKRETIKESEQKEKQRKKMCPDTGKRYKSKVIKRDGSLGQGLMSETGTRQGCKWKGLQLRYGIREKDAGTKAKRVFVRPRRS